MLKRNAVRIGNRENIFLWDRGCSHFSSTRLMPASLSGKVKSDFGLHFENVSILLNTRIERQCVFFVHFIDCLFLHSLVDSTKILSNLVSCLSMMECMGENTQIQVTKGPNEHTKTPGYMLRLYFELCTFQERSC